MFGDYKFVAQIVSPGIEYEVVPVNGYIHGHYTYTVNVRSEGGKTVMRLYKGQTMLDRITEAMKRGVASCA